MVVAAALGSSSPVQPPRVSGSTSGAVVRVARTVTGPRPTPSSPRISATAWYWCVEDTCTWVGTPIAPERTSAARAACEGMSRYCSATCTRPRSPTRDHRARSPSRSGAGGVSARTRIPRPVSSTTTVGVTSHGSAVTTKSGRTARSASSSEVNTGTGSGRSERTTAPAQERSGRPAASRQKNSARHPAPTVTNVVVMGGTLGASLPRTPRRDEPMPGLAVRRLPEREDGRGLDGEHQGLLGSAVMQERVVADVEAPCLAVLGNQAVGEAAQHLRVGHPDRAALDDDVETRVPPVGPRREHHVRVLGDVAALALLGAGAEVHEASLGHRDEGRDVRAAVGSHGAQPGQLGRGQRLLR